MTFRINILHIKYENNSSLYDKLYECWHPELGTWIPVQLAHRRFLPRLNSHLLAVVVITPHQELGTRWNDFRRTVVHLAFVLEGRQVLLLRTTSAVYIPHPVGTGLTLGIDVVTWGAVLVSLWRQNIVYNNML